MKTAFRIAMTLLFLALMAGTIQAQDAAAKKATDASGQTVTTPGKFTDNNKNGICDNHEAKCSGAPGKKFVDRDGDGKCDNCGVSGKCKEGKGQGCCSGAGKSAGKGNCCGGGQQHRNGCGHNPQECSKPCK